MFFKNIGFGKFRVPVDKASFLCTIPTIAFALITVIIYICVYFLFVNAANALVGGNETTNQQQKAATDAGALAMIYGAPLLFLCLINVNNIVTIIVNVLAIFGYLRRIPCLYLPYLIYQVICTFIWVIYFAICFVAMIVCFVQMFTDPNTKLANFGEILLQFFFVLLNLLLAAFLLIVFFDAYNFIKNELLNNGRGRVGPRGGDGNQTNLGAESAKI